MSILLIGENEKAVELKREGRNSKVVGKVADKIAGFGFADAKTLSWGIRHILMLVTSGLNLMQFF